jgi:hypothetical protein
LVYVDGELLFERATGATRRKSDFELGLEPAVP